MKAVQAMRFGGPEVLELTDLPTPVLRSGEALVQIEFAGVNFADSYFRKGVRGGATPFVLGTEGAGTVISCASDVSGVAPGDRVAYFNPPPGSYAEFAAVPAWRLVKIPSELDSIVACAAMVQGLTAHYLTHSTFDLGPTHTCLILPAASGVGQITIQLAKNRGARVIAAAGSEAKCAVARACGADDTVVYDGSEFSSAIRSLTEQRGVDVVYDSVGAATYQSSIASVRRRGTCVIFGAASGALPPFDTAILSQAGSISFVRSNLLDYVQTGEEINWRMQSIFELIIRGKLKVPDIEKIGLADAVEAHRRLHQRDHVGKMVLQVK